MVAWHLFMAMSGRDSLLGVLIWSQCACWQSSRHSHCAGQHHADAGCTEGGRGSGSAGAAADAFPCSADAAAAGMPGVHLPSRQACCAEREASLPASCGLSRQAVTAHLLLMLHRTVYLSRVCSASVYRTNAAETSLPTLCGFISVVTIPHSFLIDCRTRTLCVHHQCLTCSIC